MNKYMIFKYNKAGKQDLEVVQTLICLDNHCMPISLASPQLGGDPVDCVEEDGDTNEDDTDDKVDSKYILASLIIVGRFKL